MSDHLLKRNEKITFSFKKISKIYVYISYIYIFRQQLIIITKIYIYLNFNFH